MSDGSLRTTTSGQADLVASSGRSIGSLSTSKDGLDPQRRCVDATDANHYRRFAGGAFLRHSFAVGGVLLPDRRILLLGRGAGTDSLRLDASAALASRFARYPAPEFCLPGAAETSGFVDWVDWAKAGGTDIVKASESMVTNHLIVSSVSLRTLPAFLILKGEQFWMRLGLRKTRWDLA